MNAADDSLMAAGEQPAGHAFDLGYQRVREPGDWLGPGDDLGVTAAIPAHLPAEWHMQIEGKRNDCR